MIITHNVRGETTEEWTNDLEMNEPKRIRNNATRVLHEIISFHPNDSKRLDRRKLENLAREYINRRSKYGMFVVIPHLDDDHAHIHICGSPWSMKGESLRLSRAEFRELKVNFQEYQMEKYPELVHSKVVHDGKNRNIQEAGLRQGMSVKAKVLKDISEVIHRTTSPIEFFKELERLGFVVYYRSSRATGVIIGGRKYRFKTLGLNIDQLSEMQRELRLKNVCRDNNHSRSQGRDQ